MKSVCLVLVTLSLVFAIDQNLIQLGTNKIDEIAATNLGRFIIDLAQTHTQMRGPLNDLIQAITDLENELTAELQNLEDEFVRTTNQHLITQQNLEVDIGSAEININNARDFIDNILIPSIEQTNNKIDRVNQFMLDNRDNLSRETLQRQKDHQDYLDRISEHNSAVSAVDEALQLIGSLLNGNIALTEKRGLHQSIKLIEQRIHKSSELSPLIEVLLTLSQNFADQDQVKKIRDMLQDTRNKIVDSLNQEAADEKIKQDNYEERVKTLDVEYKEFKRQVLEATYVLAAYTNKMKSTQESLDQNLSDLESYQTALQQDQSNQAEETSIYNDLKTQYISELQTTRKANEFINSAEFSSVMREKMNQGGI